MRPVVAVLDSFDSDLDELAAKCASADAGVRRVAMLELADVMEPEAVPLLLKGLRDADATVREAAAKALDEHDSVEIVGALVAALEDPVEAVRTVAAETLAEKKVTGCAHLLIERIDHRDPFVRAAVLRALRELTAPERCARSGINRPRCGARRWACSAISRPTTRCRR
jgi:HEAT repeat protein